MLYWTQTFKQMESMSMDQTYQTFLRLGFDLSPLGVERREDTEPYFCTPVGAEIFGWAGVDGIHYCFIRGFGDMVFAVSPMNGAPDFVHPLANSFEDFLRLLLACGDAAALEQAHQWQQPQFDAFLRENPLTKDQRRVLDALAEALHLTPIEEPWAYLHALQASFDPSKLRFSEEYYETVDIPQAKSAERWQVFFDGNFWGHSDRDHAGTELPVGKTLRWAERDFVIPAAYVCGKGLVVDFCMRVPAEEIRAYMKKWDLHERQTPEEAFTCEQQLELERESPMSFDFCPTLTANAQPLRLSRGSGVGFNPCLPPDEQQDALRAVRHYKLDERDGWMISRSSFAWTGKRPASVRTLSLNLQQEPEPRPALRFCAHRAGESFTIYHPVTKNACTLTVQALEQETLPENASRSGHWLYPTHFMAMQYTLSPEASDRLFLRDCAPGDRPRPTHPEDGTCSVIGIIGGADGPTAVVTGADAQSGLHAACSSLHFEPVQSDVEWCAVFQIKEFEDRTFMLL